MIAIIKGPIEFDITENNGYKLIVDKFNIKFDCNDTLTSVREELLHIKKQHRQLHREYDTLNRKAVKSIHQTAAKSGGEIANLVFDDISSIWTARMLINVTNEDEVVVRREYTIHKKIDQTLKSCVLEKALLENQIKAKIQILEDVYKKELKVMLIEDGIDVTSVKDDLLSKSLKKSQWNLEGAKKKVVNETVDCTLII
mgnify:CR=1 FL=1|jgi:hypothetical protein